MWGALVDFVASILAYLYDLTVAIGLPSYGLAIILLTLLIKIITYPLTYKQMYSMRKMQEIQPLVAEIQKKYKKSPEKANKEIMKLYQEHKANPMSGCLPLLVQMPILIALFQALQKFEYMGEGSSFLWIEHLKNPDPTYAIPVLVALTTFLQTKFTTPANPDPNAPGASTQKMMLYFMPLFIGYISMNFPAGLGIYWIFFSVFGTLQQLYINRRTGIKKGEVGNQ